MSYDYIKRAYCKEFKPGMRVKFTESGNQLGTVRGSRKQLHYVSIKFDDGTCGRCHPDSVEIQPIR